MDIPFKYASNISGEIFITSFPIGSYVKLHFVCPVVVAILDFRCTKNVNF